MQRLATISKLFFFIIALSVSANAQIEAPDFLCVKSDTLFWNLPVNNCGPFIAYNIFASQNESGPFALLASITDPSQTSFYHDNAGNQTWYYYLESDFDCPGEIVLSSITLDNQAPEASPLLVVNVIGNLVQVEWEASPSPEVIGYIIYRVTDIGTVPIDTVYGAASTSYIDPNSSPGMNPENYYVIAFDECGNTSLLEFPHLTVFVESEVSVCEQNVNLSWNLYEGWNSGIEQQEVWVAIDGAPEALVETLSQGQTTYVYEAIDDDTNYCFHIRSYQTGSSVFSISNSSCFVADVIQPMRNITLTNASVNANNEVILSWNWDIIAEINEVQILSADQNNAYQATDIFPPVSMLSFDNDYLDQLSSPENGSVFYRIQTVDNCDSLALSNYVATVFLQGFAGDNFINQLSWTPFQTSIGNVVEYELFRVDDSGVNSIGLFSTNEFQMTDLADPRIETDANVCYFIIAEVEIELPDGNTETIFSRSNTICIEQKSALWVPNAFTPGGKNPEFKPVLVFGKQSIYNMSIWDRWGRKVFETSDINFGWNGKGDGFFEYPEGAYTYFITLTQPNGRVVEDKGVLILLR